MNNILLKNKLLSHELYRLLTEFPQYQLMMAPNDDVANLIPEQCADIEIIYGDRLCEEELRLLPHLRWIHVPSPYLSDICMNEIREQGNILINTTKEENIAQIGEFAISGILAFAKNLFNWHDADSTTLPLYEKKWKESIWTASHRTVLQVGLGLIGTEIARRAQQLGFKVWGLHDPPTFHPYCHKVLPMKDLHSVLPAVDVVCLSWPRDIDSESWFNKAEMDLMKDDSVLMVFGNGTVIDLDALGKPEINEKLRGVFLDARFKETIPPESPLWKQRNVLISSEAAAYPKVAAGQSFSTFIYNLRQFLHGNFSDMKNLSNQVEPIPMNLWEE